MMSHSHCGVSVDDLADGPRLILGDLLQHGDRAVRPERRPARRHLVEHAAQVEQVGPLVERVSPGPALGLLYIGVPAMRPPCEMLASSAGQGQPEVGNASLKRALVSSNTLPGLMSRWIRSHRMGRGQPLGDSPARPARSGRLDWPTRSSRWRVRRDELHRDVRQGLPSISGDHHAPRAAPGPTTAPRRNRLRAGSGRNLLGQHLHRDDAVQKALEDDAEPALAKHLEHLVVPGSGPLRRGGWATPGIRAALPLRPARCSRGRCPVRRAACGALTASATRASGRAGCPAGRGRGAAPPPAPSSRHRRRRPGPGRRTGPPGRPSRVRR